MVQPLDTPGCVGRRNCNVNLDNRRWDRPDQDCELQQARDIPAIFKWTRQLLLLLVRQRWVVKWALAWWGWGKWWDLGAA